MAPKPRIPFYTPLDPTSPKIWPGYTLLMPVCAVGNLGQLACDLIISTLLSRQQCQLVGRIYSPALMSVVAPNAYSRNGPPSTSTELYESKKHKLVIIQQRTSYFRHLKNLYVDELVHWIKEAKFDHVLVLTSSFAQCNPDTSHLGQFVLNSMGSITTSLYEVDDRWRSACIKTIPDKRTIKVVQDGLTFLPGSGITKRLIKACEKAFVPAAFLVNFCSEGLNTVECYEVANIVDKLVGLNCSTVDKSVVSGYAESHKGWVEPFSWSVPNSQDDSWEF